METNKGSHSGLWRGFLFGSFLGAAAGFLFAPKSGKELRSDIKGRTEKAFEGTKQFYTGGCTKFENAFAFLAGRRGKASVNNIESPEEIVADA